MTTNLSIILYMLNLRRNQLHYRIKNEDEWEMVHGFWLDTKVHLFDISHLQASDHRWWKLYLGPQTNREGESIFTWSCCFQTSSLRGRLLPKAAENPLNYLRESLQNIKKTNLIRFLMGASYVSHKNFTTNAHKIPLPQS